MRKPARLAAKAGSILASAQHAPAATLRRAGRLLASAGTPQKIVLLHAMSLAHAERGELVLAEARVRHGLLLAARTGDASSGAGLRLTKAWVDLQRDAPHTSLGELAAAAPLLGGEEPARARFLRGMASHVAGRHRQAEAELSSAVELLRARRDEHWLANALNARAATRTALLRPAEAEADFLAAASLFTGLGEYGRAACCHHNRGFAAMRAGELPRALALFAAAERAGADLAQHPELLADQAEALLAAGLVADARRLLERAVACLAAAGRSTALAETALTLAGCALRAGDLDIAGTLAARAAEMFTAQRRPAWRTAARAVSLRAMLAAQGGDGRLSEACVVASACAGHGWSQLAAELRLAAAELAPTELATRLLGTVAELCDSPLSETQILGRLAQARLARLRGDSHSVYRVADAGLRVAAGQWAPSDAGVNLAAAGLACALSERRPESVLIWADRLRELADMPRRVRPPEVPALAMALAGLRAAQAGLDSSPDAAARNAVAAQERAVRRAALASGERQEARQVLDLSRLTGSLGPAVLLSFTVHSGVVTAVAMSANGSCMRRIAALDEVAGAIGALRFALACRARGRHAAGAAWLRWYAEVDRLLLAPVADLLGDGPLIVIPAPPLHTVPWAGLPSCRGRPVSVSPSAGAWLRAARNPAEAPGATVWISGPGLRHAEVAVRGLRHRYGGTLLAGKRATTAAALSTMDGASLAHIAAHGRFREDQPMFSSLTMAAGALYGHDLARLRSAPRCLVLSACESGRSAVDTGNRLLGLSTVLLARGTSSVIASVLPVPDAEAAALMRTLHALLHNGSPPATALAVAQAAHGDLGFICLGR
ncbi:MAG: CHAT domain-containing protein [Sciscionella sp.]